ncbi:MAG: YfiR family protein [Vicingus serpentipes]|nr:YfiR family protein [Vicingus serpentipes]
MKKTVLILISILVLSSGFKLENRVDTNSRIKAVFILNFTKLIEWPQPYRVGEFVVGVVGDTPLYPELTKMAKVKKVANQTLTIKQFKTIDDIEKCHILYVTQSKSNEISDVVKKIKTNSTLIVTEQQGLTKKGAGINFIVQDNRQKFELNKTNVEKYKLKVSSNLEALAITAQ